MAFDPLAPFTGSAYTDAAGNIQNYLKSTTATGTGTVGTNLAGSLADLQAGRAGALGAIGSGVNTARSDIAGAYPQALGQLYGGAQQASGALTTAAPAALSALGGGVDTATDAWKQLLANAGGGANPAATQQSLLDALGVNGPEGTARAQANFPQSPGYQFSLDQARKTALAGANAAGLAPSGNTLDALTRLGTNYGNQAWQQYVDNLNRQLGLQAQVGTAAAGGQANAALTGGTGAANIYTGTGGKLADLLSGTGVNAAGITTGTGTNLANLAMQGGLAAGNVYGTTAAQEAAQRAGATGQTLDLLKSTFAPYSTSELAQAQAETQGPLNLFNLALNAAKFGANPTGAGQLRG